jgi:hypothetical protein
MIFPQCFDNFNFQDLPPLNMGKLPNGTYRRYSIKIDRSVDFKHIPQIMEVIKIWQSDLQELRGEQLALEKSK